MPPVDLRARGLPRVEHGAHGAAKLLARRQAGTGRRPRARRSPGRSDQPAQVVGVEVDVELHAAALLQLLRARPRTGGRRSRRRPRRTSGSAGGTSRRRSAGCPSRAASPSTATSLRPEVEDRVHHPRHRDRGARADRDEQRVRGSPKRFPAVASRRATCSSTSATGRPVPPAVRITSRHASVVTVNPAGTGAPSSVISARPTPSHRGAPCRRGPARRIRRRNPRSDPMRTTAPRRVSYGRSSRAPRARARSSATHAAARSPSQIGVRTT